MNILFVNYGDFTTNSLNHIAGFANTLSARGHACAVVVPAGKETVSAISQPLFLFATFAEALTKPNFFPNGKAADILHAWTPREGVRKFVLAYQRLLTNPARVIVHLEDNEEFLLETFTGKSVAELSAASPAELATLLVDGLPHPWRYQNLLRVADGVTIILESLRKFVSQQVPIQLLPPGVDFTQYHPQLADAELRKQLGLREDEKVIVFTGGTTFANAAELRELYIAVSLLNQRGTPTRLVRTGHNLPGFLDGLGFDYRPLVLDLGFVEKTLLPRLLALADVLVQPGRAGEFNDYRLPSKLPEFLASGRPVILPATNIAAQMEDGREALFLKTGTPEEIVTLCQQLFHDPALAARLGAAGAEFAHHHFDLGTNTSALEKFYVSAGERPSLADWSSLRHGAISEVSMLPAVMRKSFENYPDGAAAGELKLEIELLAKQLAQLERAADAVTNPQAQMAQLLEDAQVKLALAEKHGDDVERALNLGRQHIENLEQARALTQQHIENLEQAHGLTKQELENLFRNNALTKAHAENLEKTLTDAKGRLKRTEERAAISEKLLSSNRAQLQAIDADLRLTRQHSHNLEKLRDTLQQRLREIEERLSSEIQQRVDAVNQRDAKIRAMQQSFSWQITSPFRWLRRKLVDPTRPHPKLVTAPREALAVTKAAELPAPAARPSESVPSAAVFQAPAGLALWHSVDAPQTWSLAPRKTILRGWCFADDGRKLKNVRAVLADRCVEGIYGFKRLDVLAAVRNKPQAEYAGWKIEVEFATTDTLLDLEVVDEEGKWHRFFHTAVRVGEGLGPLDLTSYEKWLEVYGQFTPEAARKQTEQVARLDHRPVISVVMPVYNTPERWLRCVIESVRAQTYPHWELCIADDASPETHVRPILEDYAKADSRIKIIFREKNGHISASSNSAIELATGEFIALLDHDDELAPNALFEVASVLNLRPDTDYIYSDEDKIDEEGRRFEPYFKPDFLPDLFHGQNYTSHLSVYRSSLVKKVGGFRIGYEGSQDWDLALRVVEQTKPERIFHLPKILYHWRAIPGSTALQLSEKSYPVEAARRALTDHFQRTGQTVELQTVPGDHWRVKYPLPTTPPLVSLIIPTRNSLSLVRRCVETILAKTVYPSFEIIIVDNHSDDPGVLKWFKEIAEFGVRVLPYPQPFNYSALNNFAVKHAKGEIVGLLNNDLEVINREWLEEMVSHALRPEIGCVGAMLYYPNDAIQHAGVVVGVGGVAGHAFRDFPRGTEGKFNRARLVQNYSAVTAACLLIRKSIYEQVGGLDEKELSVAFNDIDFCLKVKAAGYRNLWTPFAEFYHHESASRGTDNTPEKEDRFRREVETMLMRWGPALSRDPAYNPNLTLELNDFSLASPPRPMVLN